MSDKTIMACTIMAAVFGIAVLFIRRAVLYRRSMRQNRRIPEQATPPPAVIAPGNQTDEDIYAGRYVWLSQEMFASSKTVRIRPEYYDRLKKIVAVIGQSEVSVIAYVDNVLKAHFEDNRTVINRMYSEGGIFNDPE